MLARNKKFNLLKLAFSEGKFSTNGLVIFSWVVEELLIYRFVSLSKQTNCL